MVMTTKSLCGCGNPLSEAWQRVYRYGYD